jgi:hypothetical protein
LGQKAVIAIKNLQQCVMLAALGALTACKPPPTDETIERGSIAQRSVAGPSTPINSPNTQGAIWVPSQIEDRIIYGVPGNPPLMALACDETQPEAVLRITRYAAADQGAGAFLALVGNGHIARIPVDSVEYRGGFVWQGTINPNSADVDVITGRKSLSATLPGAGKIVLNASSLPGIVIEECRARNIVEDAVEDDIIEVGDFTEDVEPD